MKPHPTAIAFAVAVAGVAAFSAMDAVMKGLAVGLGAYNAVLWRMVAGTGIGAAAWFSRPRTWPSRTVMRLHMLRGAITAVMAFLFFWGLARVPLAQGVALSFVAPLVALYLAALLLGEKIERRAVLASLLGFAGVVVILSGQAEAGLGPEALQGAIAILLSAALYAYNIILMRRQAQVAGPIEVAFFMNAIVCACFLLIAPFLAELPPASLLPEIVAAAALGFGALMLLSWAYARAEAQHLAPVEYTAFVWAALFGIVLFAEPVRPLTLAGAGMIVIACLLAAGRRRQLPAAAVEAAP